MSRKKAVTIIGGTSAIVSIVLFSSVNSIKLVDIVDHFINNIGIIGGALISIISIAWFKRSALIELRDHINRISTVQLGKRLGFHPKCNHIIDSIGDAVLDDL